MLPPDSTAPESFKRAPKISKRMPEFNVSAVLGRIVTTADEEIASLGLDPALFRTGRARRVTFKNEVPPEPGMVYRAREGGCASCLGAGYRGRTAIYEFLLLLPEEDWCHVGE